MERVKNIMNIFLLLFYRILYGPCPHPPTDLKLVSSEAHPSIDHDCQNDLLQMYGVLEIHDILISLIINKRQVC